MFFVPEKAELTCYFQLGNREKNTESNGDIRKSLTAQRWTETSFKFLRMHDTESMKCIYDIKGQIWNNIRKYLSTQSFIKPQGTLAQDAEEIKKINRFHKLLGKSTEGKNFYQGTLSRKDEDIIFHLNGEDKQRESLYFCFVHDSFNSGDGTTRNRTVLQGLWAGGTWLSSATGISLLLCLSQISSYELILLFQIHGCICRILQYISSKNNGVQTELLLDRTH